ncbi:PadR family transcriptional regulator [Amycolatopsis sp. 195334CR]|uniref:PadR family transcriptional regulator n=1 Tax=Amycolatopsis sp. 195334CR TaxID=2814588 RepID=UPI001A8E3835|nr:PadR family transcriptional regulator [Amycolatopsis sp. 195334CR]MBN6035643.1 PadR family transcriptional regulator [Amycolatopsis sp. 195334CR]
MSATRLLVLGAVRGFGRAHGYLVRTELLTWGADEWANVKWGSLYHALRQLAKDGLLRAIDVPESGDRVDYEITEAGDEEFFRLLREALRQPELRQDMLTAGLALLPALPRDEAIELLEKRLHALESGRADIIEQTSSWADPGHVQELFDLWVHNTSSGADWTRGLIDRLKAGAHTMAGEDPTGFGMPGTWTPTQV